MMELNLSGNLGGQIDEMLQGSVAGSISLIEPQPDPPVLDTLNVTENGTYTPPTGTDGYNEVIVDVPTIEPVLDSLSVTENGTYTPPTGTDGYNEVIVDVPTPEPVLDSLSVTQNGTYTPPSGTDGYDEVIVNVQSEIPDVASMCIIDFWTRLNEGGSTITQYTINSIKSVWNGTASIGCCMMAKLPFRNKDTIKINIDLLGNSYQYANNTNVRNFNLIIGITDNIQTGYINIDNIEQSGHLIADEEIDVKTYYNQSNIEKTIDISSFTDTDLYLFIQMPGISFDGLNVSII